MNAIGMPKAAAAPDLNDRDDEAFRAVVRDFVLTHYPAGLRNPRRRLHWSENKVWYLKLAELGWIAPGWPREWGGMGLSAAKQLILIEEYERHGCARVSDMGVAMLGPLMIRYGTAAQKRFFLPRILSGEHIWCQGYSEPNAGSDLASVRTSAELDGEEWVINGQKTWTTFANDANWMFILARTDRSVKQQAGISFLLVPMDSPGVTVRPILNLDLHDEFCEVFLDDVRVPKGNLMGEVNQGWTMAKAQLGFERIHIGSPRLSAYALARLKRVAQRAGTWDDPAVRDRYAQLRLDLADHMALYETYTEKMRQGEAIGPDVAMLKVWQSELFQRITDLMLEAAGEDAGLLDPPDGDAALHAPGMFLLARPATIYGGSSEILRNMLARSVLELPA